MLKTTQLDKLLKDKSISRREFIRRSSLLGAASMAPGLFMASAASASPKKGGHFKFGMGAGSTTDTLDPAHFTDGHMQTVGGAIYNLLVEINNNNEPIPELAESWEASPDARVWTIKLRKGVQFHNGKTMTSADVIASIEHHRGEESKSAAKPLLNPIVSMKADGDNVVIFELDGSNADFPFILSDYHMPILSAENGVVDVTTGNGTGGYVLNKFDPGISTSFKRNPNYWKEGRAHFDSAEIIAIIDVTARTNAMTTGEIHAMDRCDLKTVHLLKRNKNLRVTQVNGNQHYTIPMHSDVAPFNDNNIRLALKHAIDREALLETVLRGYGAVGNDHPIGFANRYHASDLEQRTYDPDKAKYYLKQAGMDSFKVDLSSSESAFSGAVDSAVLYKEHAAKAGIDINVVREPNDGYWSDIWLKKPWCFSFWGGRPTEDLMFSTAYKTGADWNESHFSNAHFDELLIQARAELDDEKRRGMYVEMQQLVRDTGGSVIPMFASYVSAASTEIDQGEKIASNMDNDGVRCIERWSFA